ncbi:MAG: hypothetical protein HFI67_01765 [Lachnospiraceae bacterium]|jgi:Zn-dependent M16 (insulinase) family peptidase|nr:hypothetical protein [Lachnospiraceae bacterium]
MEKLLEGTKICGFTVTRVREVKELKGTLVEMTHDKTGAELCFMDNQVKNKLFMVGFKTLPKDSTGVFHILEHSVLCGSEKYPVKEPFVDLLKSSMNTFLNAMTYPDKTVYPVSSCNEKDFLNLMSVYLDAVFAPRLLTDRNIFFQEGIHMDVENGEPYYKGVVFNEMKGAMAGIDDRIEQGICRLLFPDNCYRFNSGGDPAKIPDLTYEKFASAYKQFYHPSNARFFLDGSVPLEKTLSVIDSYLDRYERLTETFDIPDQVPVTKEATEYYEITEEEAKGNKAALVFGKIIGSFEERNKLFAAQILCDVLADSNESPLKRAVLSSGLAEDVEMAVMDSVKQPYLLLVIRGMKDEDSERLKAVIQNKVHALVQEGLDQGALQASINRFAYRCRQMSEPQGLGRAISSFNSWLYGGDPLSGLVYDEAIAALRALVGTGGFERLLGELLEEEKGRSILHMLPSTTLGTEEMKREEEQVRAEYAALTGEERDNLEAENEALLRWQTEPDSLEAAASIPTLSLSEAGEAPEYTKTIEKKEQGVTVLYHPVPTHGIVYLSLYFPLTNFRLSELTKLSLLPALFGELPTENYSVSKLQQAIKTHIGSLNFGVFAYGKQEERETCTPRLSVHAGILEESLPEAEKLLIELLTRTKFDQKDKIKEIVLQTEESAKQGAIGNGHALGMAAVQSHYTARGAATEALGGYTFLQFLHRFAKDFDKEIEGFLSLVEKVGKECICKSGLTVSVTATEEIPLSGLLAALPEGGGLPESAAYQSELPKRMGIRIPAPVAYAVQGGHLSGFGKDFLGSLRIAAHILSLGYLWSEVRVQGGAYGTGLSVRQEGGMFCYSYRDPSPERTLSVYKKMAAFVEEFCKSGEELDKFILSAIAAIEPLRTPGEEGMAADSLWFAGLTEEEMKKQRREMLSTDHASLLEWQDILEKLGKKGAVCVVGNEEALESCEGLTVCDL